MERVDVAQVLIADRGRVLVVRNRAHGATAAGWGFPGGRRQPGETLAEAARREAREETSLDVEVGRLVALGEYLAATHDLFAVFEARVLAGVPALAPGEDVAVELRWVEPDEADRLMPWYPHGVKGLLEAGTTAYYAERGGD